MLSTPVRVESASPRKTTSVASNGKMTSASECHAQLVPAKSGMSVVISESAAVASLVATPGAESVAASGSKSVSK